MRVPGGYSTKQRRKRVLNRAEGFWGHRHRSYRTAKQSLIKAAQYAYRDRKNNKRNFRRLWIQRINVATRSNGLTYSQFIAKLKKQNIILNRKMLSEMAIHDPDSFRKLCQ
ncbi:50S ribosomal protein L20 [Candidatus Mycoplasma haematobovis]|uniref:Large ribosomal subunit protein bL20 n=1 Tax=Candidatus Mycoplasma haematobovis TaxID=432608 RepID=A0A1A9QEQ5_9MOLU|nr:50S ribosomal protein L20 [Candidatus Mycoplasma haematobovis]OAL10179.1 50S ribosomal protein L20 [Candidatus Mycoplasma haematobovis]